MSGTSSTQLSIAAEFPEHFFLENIAVRSDNSLLVTVANRHELYYVPPPTGLASAVLPLLLHRFDALAGGIAELETDVFAVLTGNIYTTHDNYVHRLDLRGWFPGEPAVPEQILCFPPEMRGINGCCAVSPATLFAADTFGGAIWRVDLGPGGEFQAKLWLKHESMAHVPDKLPPPPQPGINGLRYSAKTGHLYYTTTGQKLFMRVAIDPTTREPAAEPERVASGGMYDDFCIDDARGLAYLTVHRENRIDSISLEPGGPPPHTVAGEMLDPMLLGPSGAAWSRLPDDAGHVIFVTTDGGHTAPPPDGRVATAKILRLELFD
jgi:hypothetical protein